MPFKLDIDDPSHHLAVYTEASATCRNYSLLTKKVRTLALHVLTALCIGAGIAAARAIGSTRSDQFSQVLRVIMICTASVGLIFTVAMNLIAWHFQTAFEAVRDYLAQMEQRSFAAGAGPQELLGPWSAHKQIRQGVNDFFSTYFPFVLLYVLLGAIVCAAAYIPETLDIGVNSH